MLDLKLCKIGKLTIDSEKITVSGYEADNAMCREVVILALLHSIRMLQTELEATIEIPGGTGNCVID